VLVTGGGQCHRSSAARRSSNPVSRIRLLSTLPPGPMAFRQCFERTLTSRSSQFSEPSTGGATARKPLNLASWTARNTLRSSHHCIKMEIGRLPLRFHTAPRPMSLSGPSTAWGCPGCVRGRQASSGRPQSFRPTPRLLEFPPFRATKKEAFYIGGPKPHLKETLKPASMLSSVPCFYGI
jgi:hypothetical protein